MQPRPEYIAGSFRSNHLNLENFIRRGSSGLSMIVMRNLCVRVYSVHSYIQIPAFFNENPGSPNYSKDVESFDRLSLVLWD